MLGFDKIRRGSIALVASFTVLAAAALGQAIGNGGNPNGAAGNGNAAPAASAFVGYAATAAPVATPTYAGSSDYWAGHMVGQNCVRDLTSTQVAAATTMYLNPAQDFCIQSTGGYGSNFSYSPALVAGGYGGRDGTGGTQAASLQGTTPGTLYTITAVNNNTNGYGTIHVKVQIMNATQVLATMPSPAPKTHQWYAGCVARAGTLPFGIQNSNGTLSSEKVVDLVGTGCQMARWSPQIFLDDQSQNGGAITFTADDPSLTYILAAHIVPYIEIDAGNVDVSGTTVAIEPTPALYGTFVAAEMAHYKAFFPSLGTSVPALFSCAPLNEPNGGSWPTSGTYADSVGGEAPYIHACYVAIKAAYPGSTSTVYAGELSNNDPGGNTALAELQRWYTNGTSQGANGYNCRVGTCFDAFSLHTSTVGLWNENFASGYYTNDGWTSQIARDIQAWIVTQGDPKPHYMLSETLVPLEATGGTPYVPANNSTFGAGDSQGLGQSAWVASLFPYCNADAYCDGFSYANIDEDADYNGTPFVGDGLIDTLANPPTQYNRPAYDTFCNQASYPNTCAVTAQTPPPTPTPAPTATPTPGIASIVQGNCSFTSPVSLGSYSPGNGHILVGLATSAFGLTGQAMTDSNSASYTQEQEVGQPSNGQSLAVWDGTVSGSPTATVAFASGNYACVYELANIGTPGTPFSATTASSSGATYTKSISVTAGDLIVGDVYSSNSETTSVSNGSIAYPTGSGGGNFHVLAATTGTETITVTTTSGSKVDVIGIDYSASGATPAPTPTPSPIASPSISWTQIQTSNFAYANTAACGGSFCTPTWASGWGDAIGSVWSIASDKLNRAADTNSRYEWLLYRTESTSTANSRVTATTEAISDLTTDQVGYGVFTRRQGSGQYYYAQFLTSASAYPVLSLWSVVPFTSTTQITATLSTACVPVSGHQYTIDLMAYGVSPTALYARVTDITASTICATWSGTDSTSVLQTYSSSLQGISGSVSDGASLNYTSETTYYN